MYGRWILPPLLDWAMRQGSLTGFREHVVRSAEGRVLELGIGSGLTLPLYGPRVPLLVGLDASAPLLSMAGRRLAHAAVPTRLLLGSAIHIPLRTATVDTVVMTWALCSILDPDAALREARRVLKPAGALLFVEHGLSPQPEVRRWQRMLTPLWRRISGGCHLDRKIDELLLLAGFEIRELRTEHAAGPRPMTYMYSGRARPAKHVASAMA